MSKLKYNEGDRVRIKSLDWYNENKDEDGNIPLVENTNSKYNFTKRMRGLCGKVMTISSANSYYYDMVEDNGEYFWTDEMIEGLIEEKTKVGTALNPIELKSNANCITRERVDEMSLDKAGQITDFEYEGLAYTLPEGYQFVDENGNVINATKIVLEKKKKEYPKTYEECCEILQYNKYLTVYPPFDADIPNYDALHLFDLLEALRKLIICRDAYWKIAGEDMGLGKPWEPDWLDDDVVKHIISHDGKTYGTRGGLNYINYILAFPTEKMRDAFYENFKEEIEFVKELL